MKQKKFLKGFLWKIEAGEKNLKGFPFKFTPWLVLHVLHFIVDFFYNPRASLARAAFKRDFLDNHGGRRSIAGTAQATLPHHPRPTLSPRTSALSLWGGGLESECTRGECWSGVVGQSCLSRPRYRPPTPMDIKEKGGLEFLSRPRYRPPTPMVVK